LLLTEPATSQQSFENLKAPALHFKEWVGKKAVATDDKPIILEFWATWCAPCIDAVPHLNELARKFGEEVVFISLNSYDRKDRVEKFMAKTHFETFVALDDSMKMAKELGVKLIPQTFLIDKNGFLRWRGTPGQLTEDFLHTFLKEAKIVVPEIGNPLLYSFDISRTKDRTVSSVSMQDGEKYGWEWKNRGITNIIGQLYEYMDIEKYQYRFEGPIPIEPALDLKFTADSTLPKDYVYNDVIEDLASMFGFTITANNEKVELWKLGVSNKSKLVKAVSHPKEGEEYHYREDDQDIAVRNAEPDQLVDIISSITEKHIFPDDSWDEVGGYNLVFPKLEITELAKYLEATYGLRLEKTTKEIEVKIIRFK
jgi:thiol-disulfide isomerase/thioredoxin